jgi:hypothetical protein
MVEEVELDDMIDMVDARFEMFARMGTTLGDTVLYRTRIGAGQTCSPAKSYRSRVLLCS